MATNAPNAKKRKLDYNIDQDIYDDFTKVCSKKGFAPQVILVQFMRKYVQTGQI